MELPVFSPSSTQTFSFCPRKWALEKQGWKSRYIHYPELCAWLGSAVSASLEVWNVSKQLGLQPDVDVCVDSGVRSIHEAFDQAMTQGRRITDEAFYAGLFEKVRTAVALYTKHDPLAAYDVVAVEQTLPDSGKARPDVVVRDAQGLMVVDYKVKVNLAAQWMEKELSKYEQYHNMLHYCWKVGTTRYAIVLIVLGPKQTVKFQPYSVSSEYGPIWLGDAQHAWAHMGAHMAIGIDTFTAHELAGLAGNIKHLDEYGQCGFYKACVEYGLNEALMGVDYVRTKKEVIGA